jgi:hypothetical protein
VCEAPGSEPCPRRSNATTSTATSTTSQQCHDQYQNDHPEVKWLENCLQVQVDRCYIKNC